MRRLPTPLPALTENAIALWQTDEGTLRLENGWITKATNQVAQHEAEDLARLVQTTARELSEALDAAADATSTGKRGDRFSLDAFVKELSAPHFSGCRSNSPNLDCCPFQLAWQRAQ